MVQCHKSDILVILDDSRDLWCPSVSTCFWLHQMSLDGAPSSKNQCRKMSLSLNTAERQVPAVKSDSNVFID